MTCRLTEAERRDFQEIFNLVDKDNGGTISKLELAEMLDTLAIETTKEEINRMFDEADIDHSGEIDFDEFCTIMSFRVNIKHTPDEVKRAFRCFEGKNEHGFVKPSDLIRVICTYSKEKISKESATDLVNQLEVDQNGLINYNYFVDMLLA